jgi:early secretory antigenic target protein ESAT-6
MADVSPVIKAQLDTMAAAADDVRRCHNALVQQHDDLKSFLNGLRADWHGRSGESWDQAQRNWDTSADGVYLILANLYGALSASHQNYAETETKLTSLWSG